SDGVVVATPDGNKSMTFHFVSVPEFFTTSPNYFSVKLDKFGNIDIGYDSASRTDGLAGITKGTGAADPGETNFSVDRIHSANGTKYELFGTDVFLYDLFYMDLKFF